MNSYYEEINKKKWKENPGKKSKIMFTAKKGTPRREKLDREFETFKVGLLLKKAREEKHLTQNNLVNLLTRKEPTFRD